MGGIYTLGIQQGTVIRNIFAYARDHQLQASRPEEHLRFIFERNIVIGKSAQWLAGSINANMRFDYNLYWREDDSELRFGNDDFATWQAKGHDKHSRIADPLSENPSAGDFRLKPDSPAFALGFEPFDLSTEARKCPALLQEAPRNRRNR